MNTFGDREDAFCASDERFSAGYERVQNARSYFSPDTATHVTISDFQAELFSILLLTGTHFRKWAVASLSYSPASKLHPQVIYAIVFSSRLNSLQVDKVDKENDKRASPYFSSSLYYTQSVSKVWLNYMWHANTIIA